MIEYEADEENEESRTSVWYFSLCIEGLTVVLRATVREFAAAVTYKAPERLPHEVGSKDGDYPLETAEHNC